MNGSGRGRHNGAVKPFRFLAEARATATVLEAKAQADAMGTVGTIANGMHLDTAEGAWLTLLACMLPTERDIGWLDKLQPELDRIAEEEAVETLATHRRVRDSASSGASVRFAQRRQPSPSFRFISPLSRFTATSTCHHPSSSRGNQGAFRRPTPW